MEESEADFKNQGLLTRMFQQNITGLETNTATLSSGDALPRLTTTILKTPVEQCK
jgi:hypothetical protein